MITTLVIRNWRTHKDTTLEFGKGSNVIVGVMGSGKSSIVNALSYSLFGTFPALKNKSVALKDTIMNKPNQENSASTIVTFTQEEKEYRVERLIKLDGTNEAKMYENNKLIAGPKQKDVNEKVEALLGLNYELFSRAVYAEQNELDFFLKLSPGERKKKFDELLELEKYETARKNAVSVQNELVKSNRQRTEFITQQKETIKSHEEEKIKTLITQEKVLEEKLVLEKEYTIKELTSFEKEYFSLTAKEKQHRTLEELLIKLTSRIETLKEDIMRSEKITLTEVTTESERLKKEILLLKEQTLAFEQSYKTHDLELKKNNEELRVLEYEKNKLVNEEKSVASLKGTCPTCKQILDENHRTHLTQEITNKLAHLTQQITVFISQKKVLSEKLVESEKNKERVRKEIDEKQKRIYQLEALQKQATESEIKKKQLSSLQEELPAVHTQLASLGFDKKTLDKLRDDVYQRKSTISVAEAKIKSTRELVISYQAMLQKIELIKKTIATLEAETLATETAAKDMGVFSQCLIATQVELRESMLDTINSAMTSIWQQVYPYKDFTDARLCVVEEGYDLQVLARTNGWVRVEGVLSGGERSAAALCIRIAFALVLTKKLSMLILDEPTHNLDSNAVAKLASMLREELPQLVEQIFVITHDKELESAASSNLYLLTRNKNEDAATCVENVPTY